MHKCGSIIKGAFAGFPGGGLEKLNTWYEMLQHLIHHLLYILHRTIVHRKLEVVNNFKLIPQIHSRMQLWFRIFMTGSVTLYTNVGAKMSIIAMALL